MYIRLSLTVVFFLSFFMGTSQQINHANKIIPESIEEEVLQALAHFPELYDAAIEFKFKDRIKKSTMMAQPKFSGFFKSRKKREYVILISKKIQMEDQEYTIHDFPRNVLIGWLGHELGHIMDYQDRSNMGMILFGIKYLFSSKSIRNVELTADSYAIAHGMGAYILATKNFILDHSHLSEKYKDRIRRLYISPEEVMELIEENEKNLTDELEAIEAES